MVAYLLEINDEAVWKLEKMTSELFLLGTGAEIYTKKHLIHCAIKLPREFGSSPIFCWSPRKFYLFLAYSHKVELICYR